MPSTLVTIKLFASLRPFTPDNAEQFPISSGQTVKDILAGLKVPLDDVQLVFLDGVKVDITTPLKGGERIGVFPAVGGG